MSYSVNFTAHIEPVPFKRPRFGKHKNVFDERRYSDFKDALGYFANIAMNGRAPFNGAIKLHADIFKPKPKKPKVPTDFPINKSFGDVDNHLKGILDALTGICYLDDRQVVEVSGRKFFGEPHIFIELEELS